MQDFTFDGPNGSHARVRPIPGMDRLRAEELARKLALLHAASGDVDSYTAPDGLRISIAGQDEAGLPVYQIGQDEGGGGRLSAYDDLDAAMEGLSGWHAKKPELSLSPRSVQAPSVGLREKVLNRMTELPVLDREAVGRRGLESGALGAALATLAGASPGGVVRAGLGGARGAARGRMAQYLDDDKDWKAGLESDREAVKLDDSRVLGANKASQQAFTQDRDAAGAALKDWQAEGGYYRDKIRGAVEELRAQQKDVAEGNDVAEAAARRKDAKGKLLQAAAHDTVMLFSRMISDKRVVGEAASELAKRIGIIQKAAQAGEPAPSWVYEVDSESIRDMTPAERESLDARNEALRQAGVRLENDGRRLGLAERSQAWREKHGSEVFEETKRKNQAAENAAAVKSTGDPVVGRRAGVSENYAYLRSSHSELESELAATVKKIEVLMQKERVLKKQGRELDDEDFYALKGLRAAELRQGRNIDSNKKKIQEMERQYPDMKVNFDRDIKQGRRRVYDPAKNRRYEYYRQQYGKATEARDGARIAELKKNFDREFSGEPWFGDSLNHVPGAVVVPGLPYGTVRKK